MSEKSFIKIQLVARSRRSTRKWIEGWKFSVDSDVFFRDTNRDNVENSPGNDDDGGCVISGGGVVVVVVVVVVDVVGGLVALSFLLLPDESRLLVLQLTFSG